MDFFAQQDLARRNARLLVILFTLAVIGLVLLTNLLVAGFLFFSEDYNVYAGSRGGWTGFLQQLSWERFGTISLVVIGSVLLVSLVKWLQLSAGGKAIAETLGAEKVLPQTRDADERRALNIVQEIALAASMPVPDLYLLRDERGINAFAAGVTQADAVIAVTTGALHHLKRHELQGVIGHETNNVAAGDGSSGHQSVKTFNTRGGDFVVPPEAIHRCKPLAEHAIAFDLKRIEIPCAGGGLQRHGSTVQSEPLRTVTLQF